MTAMKLRTSISALLITITAALAATAVAQNADAIDNARSTAKSIQQTDGSSAASKPAAGAPAPAVKPAAIPGAKASAQPVSDSGEHNQLQKVNVLQSADGVQIEIISNHTVTPSVSKLSSPARVLVALPETVSAAPQNHIAVGNEGVKGIRIGTDGKTPPTTSVVVDLDKAYAYEIATGVSGKLVLTLHTNGGSPAPAATATTKTSPAPAKTSTATTKTQPASAQPVAKAAPAPAKAVAANAPAAKPVAAPAKADNKAVAVKAAVPAAAPKAADAAPAKAEEAKKDDKKPEAKPEDKKWAMNGKRDPFFSPVVQQNGSGCSTGKKCLEIGNINLRGVVKSDNGFIAVVTNNLNKAYFLRENDPVFNGYVVKITGDSVVFQETVQDKLGKPFTREVVKRIFTPAV
jgi:Tfp pilus assembly protein PilP